jgi:AcrR family transcriptional regulator
MSEISQARSGSRRTVGARTGGRSKRVVDNVLRAAVDELAREGYGALRVEDVATRAGVNKTSVYRRWPTKADLVSAAISTVAGHHEPLPDTGSVRGDFIAMLTRIVAFARTAEGRAIMRLVAAEGDPEVDRLARRLRDAIMTERAKLIVRAQERGELPHGIDVRLLLDALVSPALHRVLRFREVVDPATLEAFVDLVLTGAKHFPARPAPPTRSAPC